MRSLIALLWLCALPLPGYTQGKPPPVQAEKEQRRAMDCNYRSNSVKSEERKKFINDCLKGGESSPAVKKQQEQVRNCSRRAADKGLTGDDRMKFMSNCLRS